jgi:chromosome segregation ATPase
MTTENTTPRPSFWYRLGRGIGASLRFLLRLTFILVLAIGLGAGIYYGVVYASPALYRRYVQPVRDNTLLLGDLEAQQEQDVEQFTSRLDALLARLETLEIRGDTDKETIADLETRMGAAEESRAAQETAVTDLVTSHAALQTPIANTQADLESVQATLKALQSDLEALQTGVSTVQSGIDTVSQSVAENNQEIQDMNTTAQEIEELMPAIQQEMELIRAVELLTQARLLLVQDNLGQAASTIQAGRDLLTVLQSQTPAYQVDALTDVLAYLDSALEKLPNYPSAAFPI